MQRSALLVLILAIAAASAPLSAQQPAQPRGGESTAETPSTTGGEPDAGGDTQTQQGAAANTEGEPSPFDYEASEEISEDLSVSFPVDI